MTNPLKYDILFLILPREDPVMTSTTIRNLSRCAMFTALLCVCAWVSVPLPGIALTMQTFGIFLTLKLLGGRWGTAAIGLYLLLGCLGLPVFTGFQSGPAALTGPTGGYLWGFLATGLSFWALTTLFPRQRLTALILGLFVCYACGTTWYAFAWLDGQVLPAITQCVLPYLIPDGLKLWLAHRLAPRLRRFL